MTAVAVEPENALNLHSINTVLKRLEHRKRDRRTMQIADPALLNLEYRRATGKSGGSFVIRPNPKEMRGELAEHFKEHGEMELSKTAVDSILKHGGFNLPPNMMHKNFSKLAVEALRLKMNEMHGLNILTRSSGGVGRRQVDAFIPGKINSMSDHELVSGIIERLAAQFKDRIKGVRIQSEYSEANQRFWVVFGTPVLDEKPDDPVLKTYPMLDISTSDLGLGTTEMSLGLMRIICINGAIRTDWAGGRARWNRNGPPEKFFDQVKSVISAAGQFASNMHDCLTAATKRNIDMHGLEIVGSLRERHFFSNKQAELAETLVKRDDPMTEYDMLQVATESAQILTGNARRRAESLALRAIVNEGGFCSIARNGMDMRAFTADSKTDKAE